MYYCTLDEAKHTMRASNTTEDNPLLEKIRQVSRRADRILTGRSTRPVFGPYIEQRQFRIDGRRVRSSDHTFLLRREGVVHPLLSFSAVTADGSTVTSVVEGYPQDISPIRRLRLTNDYNWYSYLTSATTPGYVAVTGIWGYHSDWANAWLSEDTIQDAGGINASVTTVTVADAGGANTYGLTPRFSPGALLRAESEYLLVTAVDTGSNELTVTRGVQGSTAAVHAQGVALEVFQVEEPIKRVVARQAGLLESQRGTYQRANVGGVGIIEYPTDLLDEMTRVLGEYAYV